MDTRKLQDSSDKYELNKEYNAISSKQLNMELANAIETSNDLKKLVMIVAATKFREDSQKNKLAFFSFKPLEIDDNPKLLYYFAFLVWGYGYYNNKVSKLSGFLLFVAIKIFLNFRRNSYCSNVKEHREYVNINKKIKIAMKSKAKNLFLEDYIKIFKNFF